MMIALVREPSSTIDRCEITHIQRSSIAVDRARTQHATYRQMLGQHGKEVRLLPALDELPDAAFVEDVALVLPEVGILCCPGAPSRVPEVGAIRSVIETYRPIHTIDAPARIEGGDVLKIGDQLWVAVGGRTNELGAVALRRAVEPIGYSVRATSLRGALHLKTACTTLNEETVLFNPQWVDRDVFSGSRIIPVDQAEPFAANTLSLSGVVLMSASCPRTREKVERAGFPTKTVDISEFEKAEAGVTCLSLLFDP